MSNTLLSRCTYESSSKLYIRAPDSERALELEITVESQSESQTAPGSTTGPTSPPMKSAPIGLKAAFLKAMNLMIYSQSAP